MLLDDFAFFIFKFTWIGLNLGGLRRRKRGKCVCNPSDIETFLTDLRVYSQRSSSEKV